MRSGKVRYSADPVDIGAHTDLICASLSGIAAQPPTTPTAGYACIRCPLRAREAPHYLVHARAPDDETELTDPEDVVHDFRSSGDHGTQFPAVHGLGRGCGAVTD